MGKPWLNFWPWAVNGFVSAKDEKAQQRALANPYRPIMAYREAAAAVHLDRGDEYFCRNAYAYIPTVVAGRGEFQANIHANVDPHHPFQPRSPSMAQMAQWSYGAANDLWAQIRAQTGTEWSDN